MLSDKISTTEQTKRYYVYTLSYPEEMGGAVFYVGKGTGKRVLAHEGDARAVDENEYRNRNRHKQAAIQEIWSRGYQVKRDIVYETDSELDAYSFEWALINIVYYDKGLTNIRLSGRTKPTSQGNRNLSSLIIEGETYLSAAEAAKYLGISRPTFYQNIQPHISEYKYGALRRIYYRQSDLDKYREIRKTDSDSEIS